MIIFQKLATCNNSIESRISHIGQLHKHIFPYIVLSNSDNSTLNKSRFYYFEVFWENKRHLGDGCLCSEN